MAEETATSTTATATAATTAQGQDSGGQQTQTAEARLTALEKELAEARKEAAARRVKAKEAEEKAAAEALKSAQEKGEWSKVIEAKEAALRELTPKASRAEKLEAVVAAEVAFYEAQVGDRAKSVAHLSPEDRLPILKEFAALAATGKPAAKSTTAGAPATAAPNVNWDGLTPDQIRERIRTMTPEQRRQLAEQQGAIATPRRVF